MNDLPGQLTFLVDSRLETQIAYDYANPQVYEEFCERALKLARKGREHLGARMIVEVIRYFSMVEADGDVFKINNNMSSYYARKFMKDNPLYEGIFELREHGKIK